MGSRSFEKNLLFSIAVLTIFSQSSLAQDPPSNSTKAEEGQTKSDVDEEWISNLDKRSSPYETYHPKHPSPHGYGLEKYRENKHEEKGYAKPQSRKEVKREFYEAITFHNFNETYHCGVIPDTNFELYQSHPSGYGEKGVYDVAPFGKYPWTVLITYKNKYICTGVLIQSQHVLTSSSCVPEYRSLSKYGVRVGDWDIVTNYNEYEGYQNEEYEICGRYSVGKEDYGHLYRGYGGQGYSSDLVLLRINGGIDYDKRPHVKPICLSSYQDEGYAQAYPAQGYQAQGQYGKSEIPYLSESYGSDGYKSDTHCWVVGWYGSISSPLKNHPQPSKQDDYKEPQYYQKYYKGYDKSFIQKRAKVREVKCQDSSYYKGDTSKSVCFVGVEGYDSCVADQGAAVFCVIPEKSYGVEGDYDAGYTRPQSYYGAYPSSAYPSPAYQSGEFEEYEAEVVFPNKYGGPYGAKGPYRKDIKAYPTPPKAPRYRAVLYAIVQKPGKCRRKNLYSSGKKYGKEQSRPIRATKVDYQAVRSIMSTFWGSAEDQTCPVPKNSYRGFGGGGGYKSYGKSIRRPHYHRYDIRSYWF